MRLRWIAFVQLWACAALATEPGKDFSVDITWPLYAQRMGEADTVPVHVRVQGCDDVRLDLMSRLTYISYSETWRRQSAEFSRAVDGTLVTDVDLIKQLGVNDMSCWADADRPATVDLQVVASCNGDGREATSRILPVRFAVADFANSAWDVERYLPIDANRVLAIGRDYFAIQRVQPTTDDSVRYNGTVVTYHSARQSVGLNPSNHTGIVAGSEAYVSDACMFPHCHDVTATDPVTGVQLTAQASTIFHINTDGNSGHLVSDLLEVPGAVVRMLQDDDGRILVLSANRKATPDDLSGSWQNPPGWVLSRIDGNQLTTLEVDADSELVRDSSQPGQGPAEISRHGEVFRFHNLKFPHEAQTIRIPGIPPENGLGGHGYLPEVSVSPDATQWLLDRADGTWLSDGVHDIKLHAAENGIALISSAWQQDTLALTYYNFDADTLAVVRSTLLFFDRHTGAQVGQFRPSALWDPLDLVNLKSLSNNRFAVSSQSGVTIVDARGNNLAATRLPEACKGSLWHEELPDGRLLWVSGRDRMQQMFVWDINMYQSQPTP